ncbi:MAG TPA: hypothetical protein VGD13_12595 [Xanthobacteraceae bacterium]|jgi:hypothetical protein
MPEYRIYSLDPAGHFNHVQEIVCADDAASIERATQMTRQNTVEVWHRGQFVAKIERGAQSDAATA